jgi:MATE family, multidrug efflux pump
MQKKNKDEILGTMSIGKLLMKLSIPATIGMVVNALYNVVDAIYLGRGVGPLAIGGLTIVFPFQMIVMAIGMTIGVGAASVISRNLGSGDRDRAYHAAGSALTVSILIGLLMMIGGAVFLDQLLRLFGASETLLEYARSYLSVILIGIPLISFSMTSNNIVRAEGKATTAMISMLIGTGMNIILDPIFIFLFNMGIQGAAIATVISQGLSFLYLFVFFVSGKSSMKLRVKHLIPDIKLLKEIILIGLPAFVRQAGGSVLAVIMNNVLLVYGGDYAISSYGVINKLMMFTLMPLFGIVQGFQPIAGYNYGAKKFDRVQEVIKLSILITTIMSTFSFLLMMIFPDFFVGMFTTDEKLISISVSAIRRVIIFIPLLGLQIIGAAFFQSVGKALPSLILGMTRQIIFLIPLVIILPNFLGLNGVWFSFPGADIGAVIVTLFWLMKELKNLGILHMQHNKQHIKAGSLVE